MKKILAVLVAAALLISTCTAFAATPIGHGGDPVTPVTPSNPSTGDEDSKNVNTQDAAQTETEEREVAYTVISGNDEAIAQIVSTSTPEDATKNASDAAATVVASVQKEETKAAITQKTAETASTIQQATANVQAVVENVSQITPTTTTKKNTDGSTTETTTTITSSEVKDTQVATETKRTKTITTTVTNADGTTTISTKDVNVTEITIKDDSVKESIKDSVKEAMAETSSGASSTASEKAGSDATDAILDFVLGKAIQTTDDEGNEIELGAAIAAEIAKVMEDAAENQISGAVDLADTINASLTTEGDTTRDRPVEVHEGALDNATDENGAVLEAPSANEASKALAEQFADDPEAAERIKDQIPAAVVAPIKPQRKSGGDNSANDNQGDIYIIPINPFNRGHWGQSVLWNVIRSVASAFFGGGRSSSVFGDDVYIAAAVNNVVRAGDDRTATFLNSAGEPVDHIPGLGEHPENDPEGFIVPGYLSAAAFLYPDVEYTPVITVANSALETEEFKEANSDIEGINEIGATEQTATTQVTIVTVYEESGKYSTLTSAEISSINSTYNTDYKRIDPLLVSPTNTPWTASDDALLQGERQIAVRRLPELDVRSVGVLEVEPTDWYLVKVTYGIQLESLLNQGERQIARVDQPLVFYPNRISSNGVDVNATAPNDVRYFKRDMTTLTSSDVIAISKGELADSINEETQTASYEGYVALRLARDRYYRPFIAAQTEVIQADNPNNPNNPENPESNVGSSGGGCSFGWSSLALAALSGILVYRKKSK